MAGDSDVVTVLLGGDVMLGRGVDQILPHPGDPELRESYMRDARGYVTLAERVNGAIPRPVDWEWPWGDALAIVDELAPDVRLVNLETTITADGEFAAGKPVCYRMHPDNVPALSAFRPDVCALANNHVLDFGRSGMTDTLAALTRAGIGFTGAGADLTAARRPAVVDVDDDHRVLIASIGLTSAGVFESWAAHRDRSGVWLVHAPSHRDAVSDVMAEISAHKRDGDVVIVSVHWGSNWGYGIEHSQVAFAHRLIDAGVDIVHGHSSHHPRPIEIYRGRPILYGCGDVIDDYEGIGGHEAFRGDLRLLYVASVAADRGDLVALQLIPLRVRQMRLQRAARSEADWLRTTVEHTSRRFGTRLRSVPGDLLEVGCTPS